MHKLITLLALLLFCSPVAALAQADVDGDGVEDSVDACVGEDASFFDADGDGCIDASWNMRHVEYWDLADLPLNYVIHSAGAPNIVDGSDFTAIQNGFGVWSAVPNATLTSTYDGTTGSADANGMDGINQVTFQDSQFLTVYGSAVLAVGITTSFTEPTNFMGTDVRPGQIVDADMLFNPIRTWATDTGRAGVDLESVSAHEAGHLFGISHSSIVTATMFPALPTLTNARTLEPDDQLVAFMAYPDPEALASANAISGSLTDGSSASPIGGAAVFLISAATADTTGSQYTAADGTYQFIGMPDGDYFVAVSPLEGTFTNGVVPALINEQVEAIATNTLWNPEFYDAAESSSDDPMAAEQISVSGGSTVANIDIVTNVDSTGPVLVQITPDGSTSVSADAVFFVEFDEIIDFDSATTNVRLNSLASGTPTPVGFALLQVSDPNVLIIDPATRLDYSTQFEIVLQAGLADRFGNGIGSDVVTSFTTEAAPPLAITTVSPAIVAEGTVAVIYGEGFDESSAANNSVTFNGLTATASTVNSNAISVVVPEGIVDGPVDVIVTTLIETSNTLQIGGVISNDFVKGTEVQTVALSGDVGNVALLPDAAYGYITSSTGLNWISSGFANPDIGATGLIAYADGFDDVAIAPDGNRVYAVSEVGQELVVINSDYGDVSSPNPTFNTVLDQLPVGGTPLAVAVDPAGERAYVLLDDGDVQIWDVELGSATYHLQVGLLDSPLVSGFGSVAVDRTGLRVLALSATGEVLVWDASDPTLAPAQISVGGDPQDITIDPKGTAAYITDATGSVHVLLLATNTVSQVISIGGDPKAMAVTPSGDRGYVADRANDQLPGIDLEVGSPTFRTVTADLQTGDQPVDLAVSPDADYLLMAQQGTNEVLILGISQGPELYAISPAQARPGDIITLRGSGFASMHPTVGITTTTRVYFGDTVVVPTHSSSTSCWVRVPPTFTGGPVKVSIEGPVFVGLPSEYFSNPVSLPLAEGEAASFTDYDTAAFLLDSDGYPWDFTNFPLRTLAPSPTGKFILTATNDNNLHMLDTDQSSPNLGQVIGSVSLPLGLGESALVVANDGKLAYVGLGDGEIHIIDTDPESPTFLTDIGTCLWQNSNQGTQGTPDILRITPSGEMLVATDFVNDQIYFIDLVPTSPTYHQMITETGPIGFAIAMEIHPTGLAAYMVATTGLLHMIDLDPFSNTYLQQFDTSQIPTNPQDIEFSPSGDYAWITQIVNGGEPQIVQLDISGSNLFLPTLVGLPQSVAVGLGVSDRLRSFMSPSGERLVVDVPGSGLTALLQPRPGDPVQAFTDLGQVLFNGTNSRVAGAWNADGSGLWSITLGDSGIRFIDVAVSRKISPVSGQGQTGVAGQPLATPLTYFVDDGAGNAGAGAVAEVRVTGGGGSLSNGGTYQWVTVDDSGLLEVDWTMGPVPDPTANQITISFNDGTSVADNITISSVADPNTEPISQSGVLPVDTALDVSVTSTAQVTFSRAVDLSTVVSANIGLRLASDGTPVDVVYGFASGNTRVSMIPLSVLPASTAFEIYTTAALADTDGNALTNPNVTTFTTQDPPVLAISAVSPPAATVGTEVVISGTGFSPVAADNVVNFGAASSPASSAGPGYVAAYVPLGATTGDLTVSVAGDTSNALAFSVLIPETAPLDEVVSTVDTGISVQGVAVTPDGTKAYTVSTETNEVIPVDLATFTNLAAIGVGSSPQGVVIHPDGTYAYVTNFGSGTVSVIEVASDTVVATINVGANPVELVASPIGDRLYVVNSLDQTISAIDIDASSAAFHTVVATVPTTRSTKGAAITPDGSLLYLGTSDGWLTIDLVPTSFGVVGTYSTGRSTKGAAITPDGSLLLLVTTTNEVLVVDISVGGSNTVVATVPTTRSTKGAAITPDGTLLYLIEEGSNEVLVVELNISSSVSSSVVTTPPVVTATLVKTFEVDPDPGVIAFDPSGSGLGIVGHQNTGGQLTFLNVSSIPFGQLEATVEVNPSTLNQGSRGRYVTGIVELPAGVFVENIDLSTVKLNDLIPPEIDKTEFIDRNQDSINELSLKFDRKAVQEALPQGDYVPVWINGLMDDGRSFAGEDTIRTIRPQVTHPAGNEAFYPGQNIMVTWASPEGVDVACVDLFWSPDDGTTWTEVAVGVEDTGAYAWVVPDLYTDRALMEVTIYDTCDGTHQHGENIIGVGISQDTFFIMDQAVPVVMQSMELGVHDGAGRLEWSIADPQSVEGFHVFRSSTEDGEYVRVSDVLVTAMSTKEGVKFVFEDDSIFANRDYFYMLQEDREIGKGFDHGPFRLNWALENALYQNRPNSFNPRTTISFSIAKDGRTRLAVYNLAGRLVDVIVDEVLRADTHEYTWDGKDRSGRSVASGVYVYRLQAPDGFVAAKKMTLVR